MVNSVSGVPSAWPPLYSAERTPFAIPRRDGGTSAMIDAVFGEVKIPTPPPISTSAATSGPCAVEPPKYQANMAYPAVAHAAPSDETLRADNDRDSWAPTGEHTASASATGTAARPAAAAEACRTNCSCKATMTTTPDCASDINNAVQ